MKAVIYHADSQFAWGGAPPSGFYERLFREAKENFKQFGFESTVHLTVKGFPGWGDENHFYDLDPRNIVANREECFYQFLKDAPEDVYWFTETDCRILRKGCPPLRKADLALCYRKGDDVPIPPSWRLATKAALPIFEECVELIREDPRKDWHGDSAIFTKLWHRMGKPTERAFYKGVRIEFREFRQYVKPGEYMTHFMGPKKLKG